MRRNKIQTFAPVTYKDIEIIVRNFGTEFEYLMVIDGKIYTQLFTVSPDLFHSMLSFLGRRGILYSDAQLKQALVVVQSGAMATIDLILNKEA
jgi:hypothetical protein